MEIPATIAQGQADTGFFTYQWEATKYAKGVREQITQFDMSLAMLAPQQMTDAATALLVTSARSMPAPRGFTPPR